MKGKTWFPVIIVLVGAVFLGIGIWQMANTKIKSAESLKKAEKVVQSGSQGGTPGGTQAGKDPQVSMKNSSPGMGDAFGILSIPKIKANLAIVEGTNPDDLEKGVGHYKGSYFPGDQGQIVLSGHRDTVFRKLGELKIGDPLLVKIASGNHQYKITRTKIVDSDDKSIITLQNSKEELVLTTCYPFRYVGNAPKRYIIYAVPK